MSRNTISMKIFKSNIMYNSFVGVVRYSRSIVIDWVEIETHFAVTALIVRHLECRVVFN